MAETQFRRVNIDRSFDSQFKRKGSSLYDRDLRTGFILMVSGLATYMASAALSTLAMEVIDNWSAGIGVCLGGILVVVGCAFVRGSEARSIRRHGGPRSSSGGLRDGGFSRGGFAGRNCSGGTGRGSSKLSERMCQVPDYLSWIDELPDFAVSSTGGSGSGSGSGGSSCPSDTDCVHTCSRNKLAPASGGCACKKPCKVCKCELERNSSRTDGETAKADSTLGCDIEGTSIVDSIMQSADGLVSKFAQIMFPMENNSGFAFASDGGPFGRGGPFGGKFNCDGGPFGRGGPYGRGGPFG